MPKAIRVGPSFLADPADIALGISADGDNDSVLAGLEAARELGLLTSVHRIQEAQTTIYQV
ncbi:MAG: hypothetical protein ACRDH7_15175, partial [Actinomycetota bacterium]